jgi:RHS repeat-associated protein
MSRGQSFLRIPTRLSVITFLLLIAPAFAIQAHAQYTTAAGTPTFTTALPVEMGFTNVANGNLHIEIPLASFPQRGGLTYNARLVYDSLIWNIVNNTWQPSNIANSMGGWRLITGGEPGAVTSTFSNSPCDTPPPIQTRTVHTGFVWTAPDGTSHRFPIFTQRDRTICAEDITSDTEMADDSSGYTMSVTNYTSATVYAPDGTQVFPTVMDTNGNFFSKDASGNIIDTLQRTPITTTTSGNSITYAVLNPQGTRTNITVTTTTVSANTAFGQSGVAECNCSVTAIQSIAFSDGTSYNFTYDSGTSIGHFAVLTSMKLRTGGTVSYGYTLFADLQGNHSVWFSGKEAGGSTWLYNPQAMTITTNQVAVSEPSGDSITYLFSLNNGAWTSSATYSDAIKGNLLFLTNTWDTSNSCPINSGCTGAAFVRQLTSSTQFPGGLTKNVTFSYASPITGQISEIDESDYSTSAPPILRKTLFSYASLINTVSKPSQVTVKDPSNNVISQTSYSYDQGTVTATTGVPQHTSPVSSRGNVTNLGRWLNTTGLNLNTAFTYDDTGNRQSMTDPGGHSTQFSYADNFSDSVNRNSLAFLTAITAPDTHSPGLAHHVTRGQYDFNTGLRTASTDQNGHQTTFTYDSQMRSLQTNLPDGGQINFSYPSATQSEVQAKIDGTRSTYFTTILDSLGRKSRTAKTNGEALQYDVLDFCYDGNGRVNFQAYPYQSTSYTGAAVCSGSGDSFSYDALDRPTKITHSDSSNSTIAYTARARQITDEGNGSYNVSRILQSDGLGRLTKVCEVSSSTLLGSGGTPASCSLDIAGVGFLTSYGYDLLDNLITVTQGSLTNRALIFDSLSRVISESHPEWGSGSQATYTYNSDGMLIGRVRPSPNQTTTSITVTTNYGYDELHRLISRTYTGDTTGTASAAFNYDEPSAWSQSLSNTIGFMSSESAGSTGQAFSYDSLGRVSSNWQFTPRVWGGTPYFLAYGYDLFGDLTSSTNGAGVTFAYTYNSAPRLNTITSTLVDAQHPGTLLSSIHYGPFGPVNDTLGNGLAETIGYSARGQSQSYSSTPYSFSVTGLAGNGKITAAADSVNGAWTYSYGQMNQLMSSSKTTSPVQGFSYVYDRYGNRWQENVTQGTGPQPQYLFDNTANRINGSGITYDAQGNVTADGLGNAFTYDAESRMIQVANASGTFNYIYDAEGRRVRNSSTEFLYDLSGRAVTLFGATNGIWNFGEIYAGGRHLGTYSNSTTTFIHPDWLGSKRLVSSLTGASSQTCNNLPYGDGGSCSGPESGFNHFTDDIHDGETNLEHTWFRTLSTTQGRWLSPDPYLGSIDLSDPQSLNRYSYVSNDPLSLLDPLGLSDNGPGQQTCGFGGILLIGDAFCQLLRALNGTSGSGTGGPSRPFQKRPAPTVSCNTVLPNGKTVGDYVRELREQIQGIALAISNSGEGDFLGAASGAFFASVGTGGPIDFKNNFFHKADGMLLGDAGNFAYYASGSGILPDSELDFGAGVYAVKSAIMGRKHFSDLTGRMFSDSSAARVRDQALAANGCQK